MMLFKYASVTCIFHSNLLRFLLLVQPNYPCKWFPTNWIERTLPVYDLHETPFDYLQPGHLKSIVYVIIH